MFRSAAHHHGSYAIRLAPLLAAAVLTLAAQPLGAIVYEATGFPTLVNEASVIVLGRVTSLQPQWTEGRRGIETLVAIDVERYFKGDLGRAPVFRVPGGQMGPYLNVMPGAPRFAEGEEVVVFLAGAPPAVPHLLALGQGVFRVVRDASTGAGTVVPELLLASGAAVRVVRGDLTRRPAALGRFEADVRAILAPLPARGRR